MISTGFLNNTSADIRLIGLESGLSPFVNKVSSQRTAMFSSHLTQSLVLEGNEFPRISTGYESMLGEYEFNKTTRDQDIQIIAIIPKYVPNVGMYPIRENSSLTVIYLGMDSNQIHYFDMDKYSKGSDGFGYLNKDLNTHLLSTGNVVAKDIPLQSSPSLHGNMYNMGINANVAFLTRPDVTDDAFVISESLAKKMKTTAIRTINININPSQVPVNLYGDSTEYRFFPDIGDIVRDDGIMCAFRTPNNNTFVTDMTEHSLSKVNLIHDMMYTAPPGSVVLDVDAYVNRNNKSKTSKSLFNQVYKYTDHLTRYYKKIIDVYHSKLNEGYEISPEFNTLVTKAMAITISEGHRLPNIEKKNKIKLIQKKDPVEFINLTITYMYECNVSVGFKITDRHGGKGVISAILPDEDMPIDDFGIRADYIVDPITVPSRMNPGQLYEVAINRISLFVTETVKKMNNLDQQIDYVLTYLGKLNPNYSELIRSCITSDKHKQKFIDGVIKDGLYVVAPPFLETMNTTLIDNLKEEYGSMATPVSYNIRDSDGNLIRRVRTKCDVSIGSKYIYLLYKIPSCKSPGVGYTNQYQTPDRPTALAKHRSLIGQTPLRLGEDENRNLTMTVGSETTSRLMNIHANSPVGVNKLIHDLLTNEKPSTLTNVDISSEELTKTNNIIHITKHMFATLGIDAVNTTIGE